MRKENTFVKHYSKNSKGATFKKVLLVNFSNVLFLFGIIIFIYFVGFPTVVSKFYTVSSNLLITPFEGSVLSYTYESGAEKFYFKELESIKKRDSENKTDYDFFYITIPKLNISNAQVKIDSDTLDPQEFLGHYPGTSLPGEAGNSFIFGHSSLPIFYDPKDYKTIFSKIPTLEKNDKIIVKMGSKEYLYSVQIKRELLPKDVNPYSNYYPSLYHKSTITLMTCTPLGTKKYRYIVLAELISVSDLK